MIDCNLMKKIYIYLILIKNLYVIHLSKFISILQYNIYQVTIFHNFLIVNFDLFLEKEHLLLNNQIYHRLHIYHLNKYSQEKIQENFLKIKHLLKKSLKFKIQLKN